MEGGGLTGGPGGKAQLSLDEREQVDHLQEPWKEKMRVISRGEPGHGGYLS